MKKLAAWIALVGLVLVVAALVAVCVIGLLSGLLWVFAL